MISDIPDIVKVLGALVGGLAAVFVVLLVLARLWARSIEHRAERDRRDRIAAQPMADQQRRARERLPQP